MVLEAQLSRGVMAVTSGPLTPLFGDDEALRLTQYGTALAPALDRVMLVERMRRSAQLLDLAYDAVTTWNVRTQLITFWNKGAEELYGWGSDEAIGRDPGELLRSELPESREAILAVLRAGRALGGRDHPDDQVGHVESTWRCAGRCRRTASAGRTRSSRSAATSPPTRWRPLSCARPATSPSRRRRPRVSTSRA